MQLISISYWNHSVRKLSKKLHAALINVFLFSVLELASQFLFFFFIYKNRTSQLYLMKLVKFIKSKVRRSLVIVSGKHMN
jgi:hypothetical protein